MAGSDHLRSLAGHQRRRLVATVMGTLEKKAWPFLSEADRAFVRTKIVSAIDSYHDLLLDVAKVYEEEADTNDSLNQEALRLLRLIHREVQEL